MAFAVMDVLRSELGLRVPDDVSVAGFDDVPPAAWPAYDLTTFRQRVNRMVAETVTTLMARIEGGGTEPRRVSIDGTLIVRGSTRSRRDRGHERLRREVAGRPAFHHRHHQGDSGRTARSRA